jgi:hypothetical protein
MNNVYLIQSESCGPMGTADAILITVGSFNILENWCTVNFILIDSVNKRNVAQGWRRLEGTDYANWGQDNTYVKTWLFTELGLSDRT